jgi:hypothetical protein
MAKAAAKDVSRSGAGFYSLRYYLPGLKRFHEFRETAPRLILGAILNQSRRVQT